MNKGMACIITCVLIPVLGYGQDCCGPGGGGGSGALAPAAVLAGSGDYVYRLKNVRPYAYSARRPGFTAGLETGGSFQFWHIHHGEPLDRGLYRYELRQGILTAVKEGTGETAAYTYTFSGKTVTLTPVRHGGHQADAVSAAAGQGDDEHGAAEPVSSGRLMGALPDAPVTFTEAR